MPVLIRPGLVYVGDEPLVAVLARRRAGLLGNTMAGALDRLLDADRTLGLAPGLVLLCPTMHQLTILVLADPLAFGDDLRLPSLHRCGWVSCGAPQSVV
ncbi:hypothetical protein OHA19_44175 (plasmid) [Streptomyces sp. NBC_00012]|uniref:hypothetical protein n=1 Tax=unclassified Streptomyces TaxID=2593676 RepID=UPI0032545524